MNIAIVDPQTAGTRARGRRVPGSPAMLIYPMLGDAEKVGFWKGNRIFEDYSARNYVAASGTGLIRTAVEGYNYFWPFGAASPSDAPPFANHWARTLPAGERYLQLRQDGEQAIWYVIDGSLEEPLTVPAAMTPVLSNSGTAILYFEHSAVFRTELPGHDLWVGPRDAPRALDAGGPVMGACFTPDSEHAFVLVRQSDGASKLMRISADGEDARIVARDLDTPPYWPGSIIFTATDDHVYLHAASTGAPNEILRQRPVAARQTKIYRLPRNGGVLELVATSGSELSDSSFAAGNLHWIKNISYKSVAVLPASGGALRDVMIGGYIAEWSPESDRLAYTVGQFRIADWAVCLDSHEVSIDENVRPIADPVAVVDGSHEDFTHVYSPCGRWIAYHSHSGTPTTAFYDAEGTRDGLFVRAADDYEAPAVEMSEDAWEIFTGKWSPDGRQLLYWSWDRKGHPGLYNAFVIDFDPETGAKLGLRKLPMPEGIINPTWLDFSPDGSEIVVEDSFDIGQKALWVIAVDGSSGRRLHDYTGHTYGGAAFSRDGETIFFSGLDDRHDTMQLFSIPASGGAVSQLTEDDHNILYPAPSPNGKWIAVTRHTTVQELWRAPVRS